MSQSSYKHGVSAALVVYNEEKIIERCLQSLAGAVDEIVVIHDGECRDATLEIARRYTEKVIVAPHTGESELHKITALEYAACDWILRVDADEFLSEGMRAGLRPLIDDDRFNVYAFLWPIWNGSEYITTDAPYKDILFRREAITAVDFPHKTYSARGARRNVPLLLEHRPKYNNFTLATFRRKWRRWIKDQAEWTCNHHAIRFYNCTPEEIAAYHRLMEKQIRFAHPLLAPGWFALSFSKFFARLKCWKHPRALNVAFLQGLYAARLCLDLWDLKRAGRAQPASSAAGEKGSPL